MQEQQRRFPVGIVVGLSTLVVTAGSATAFFAWQQSQKSKPTPPVAIEQSQPSPSSQAVPSVPPASTQQLPKSEPKVAPPATEKTVQVYWVKDKGSEVELSPMPLNVKSGDRAEDLLTAAFNNLLSSPPDATLSSTIPPGTQLRSLKVKPNGIYVDLSKAFTTGGGTVSMMTRVGQIVYTATSLDPNAKVYLFVEGQPLENLGGEGIPIEQPLTRAQFNDTAGPQRE